MQTVISWRKSSWNISSDLWSNKEQRSHQVSNSSELFCLNIKSHYRGKKRLAETNDIVKMPHPKEDANNMNAHDSQPMLVTDSGDDMGVQSGNDGPKHSLIDIQISEWLRSPDARLNGPKATQQATFEDLNWVLKILATEDEKQAQWRKAAERDWVEDEVERKKQEAVKKEKRAKEQELNHGGSGSIKLHIQSWLRSYTKQLIRYVFNNAATWWCVLKCQYRF